MAPTAAAADESATDAGMVGMRIRTIRRARRMTIEGVAESSGLTKSFLSKVERGKSSPSVAALIRIAGALEIPLASLFENNATRHVQRADSYPQVEFGGTGLTEYLLTPHAEQRIQAIMTRIAPGGGSGDEPYHLPGDVEFLYVVSGTLRVDFPDGPLLLEAGDAVTFEPSTPRAFSSASQHAEVTILWVIAPALPRSERRRE